MCIATQSDVPGEDAEVKTGQQSYKTWITEAFNNFRMSIKSDDEAWNKIATTIANKCRSVWVKYRSPDRSVWVAILNKPGCRRDVLDRAAGPVIYFEIANLDIHVVIKYVYHTNEQENEDINQFCDAISAHNALTLAKDIF